jgi:diacylglycerol kinase family enzyme
MRLVLLVNTSASSVTPRVRVVIQKALSAQHEVVLRETNRRGHAARIAQGAAAAAVDAVVVLGGDGTLNEAANGLAGSPTALAVLPGGSTNVFARSIGMANDPLEATTQLLECLGAPAGRVGLGQANSRYFLLHAGVGFDAAVVARVEKMARLKRYAGPAVFVAAALVTLLGDYGAHAGELDVELPDGQNHRARFAICLNTAPYTFFGRRPVQVLAGTSLEGALGLMAMDDLGAPTLARVVRHALGHGLEDRSSPHVRAWRELPGLCIRSGRPVPYQLDGDYVGESCQIVFSWHDRALALVRPAPVPSRPGVDR